MIVGRRLWSFRTTIGDTDWCRHRDTQRKLLSTGFLHQQSSAHLHRVRPVASSSPPISTAANTGPAGRRSVDEPSVPAPSDRRDRPISNPGNSLDDDISDQRSMIACRLPTCFSRAAGHRVPLRNGNLAGSCITRPVGDISHNARFTHIADRTESHGLAVSARWRPAAVAPRLRRRSESRCRTPRDAADR